MRALLEGRDYDVHVCGSVAEVADRLDDVGCVLLTEECLSGKLETLRGPIDRQPPWSNVPFVLLAAPQPTRSASDWTARQRLAEFASNLIVLERPLGAVSLISAIDTALRGREKQFELRDRLDELAESREALRQSAEALEEKVVERTRALELEVANRSRAEAALRQSQKMEAVGQLTGGIAHDFNNMLTGIMGALDLIKRRIASGRLENLDRYMDAASVSAQRAAGLTQRLLAFSRRQSLDSRPLDVNELLRSLDDLLGRSLSERIDLRIGLADDLPAAIADANQLENAILNLVLNARDAMPEGGRLSVETSFVHIGAAATSAASMPDGRPGGYVIVEVRDTGVGMDEAVLEKVFDPFFTTKPLGQGTGLGLSMVYGFAKQSGGFVRIDSKPGHGTSVRIYLPAADRAAENGHHELDNDVPIGSGQTVLVVEDDASVRLVVREALSELGYGCLVAQEALGAIPILASARRIDLLISDVGLPGMTGRELAEVARQHRPELPILLITGYTQNAAIRSDFLGTNMDMITKPFPLDVLGAKINEMLQPRA
ncbi:MAG: response regulator [Alphaproteobacteria bacterium]|nr:response regulator [Alphaproteobacteria bacterium]